MSIPLYTTMMPETSRIAVVVLHYTSLAYTRACLKSLAESTVPASWIIVVNNGSDATECVVDGLRGIVHADAAAPRVLCAGSVPALRTLLGDADASYRQEKLFCIEAEQNRGYGAGNNLGLALALDLGADAVWLLNNDTMVASDALGAMREKLFSGDRPGLCGPLVRFMSQPDTVQCRAGGWTNPWTCLSNLDGYSFPLKEALDDDESSVEARLNFIYGAAVMASRDFLTTVGLLDERFFIYCEEQDWAFRAAGRFTLSYASKAHVWHREGVSTGWPSRASFFAVKHLLRSRLLLAQKHNPAAVPVVCLSMIFAIVRGIFRRLKSHFLCAHGLASAKEHQPDSEKS